MYLFKMNASRERVKILINRKNIYILKIIFCFFVLPTNNNKTMLNKYT